MTRQRFVELFFGVLALAFMVALIVTVAIMAPKQYNEYVDEYEAAPDELLLEIESITLGEKAYKVVCVDGSVYYTATMAFDEDVIEPTLLLEKVDEPAGWFRFFISGAFGSGRPSIYVATIYMWTR